MVYYIYIIENSIGKRYIGQTSNIDSRLVRHNTNKVFSTKNRGPWMLVHSERFPNRSEAIRREKELKNYKGGNSLKKILAK